MITTLRPVKPLIFQVGEDNSKKIDEEITAKDFLEAFCRWWRMEGRGDPAGMSVDIMSSTANTMLIWVGDDLFKVRDVTQYNEE